MSFYQSGEAEQDDKYSLLESQIVTKSYQAQTYKCEMRELKREGFIVRYDKGVIGMREDRDFVMARIYHSLSVLQNFQSDKNKVPELLWKSEDDDGIEIITEYIGDNIKGILERKEIYCEQEAIYLLKMMLRSLSELHQVKNVFGGEECHLNILIKPESLMVRYSNRNNNQNSDQSQEETERVDILFSNTTDIFEEEALKSKSSRELERMLHIGNEYSAPESVKHKVVSVQSNLFSIGCIFYELLFHEKFIKFSQQSEGKPLNMKQQQSDRVQDIKNECDSLITNIVCKDISISNYSIQILSGLLAFDSDSRFNWQQVKQKVFELKLDQSIDEYDFSQISQVLCSKLSLWTGNSKSISKSNYSDIKQSKLLLASQQTKSFAFSPQKLNKSSNQVNSNDINSKSNDGNIYLAQEQQQTNTDNNQQNFSLLNYSKLTPTDMNKGNRSNLHPGGAQQNEQVYMSFTDENNFLCNQVRSSQTSQLLNNASSFSDKFNSQNVSLQFLKESFMKGVSKKSLFQDTSKGNDTHNNSYISTKRSQSQMPNHTPSSDDMKIYHHNTSNTNTSQNNRIPSLDHGNVCTNSITHKSYSELFVPLADPSKGLIYQGNKSFNNSDFTISTTSINHPFGNSAANNPSGRKISLHTPDQVIEGLEQSSSAASQNSNIPPEKESQKNENQDKSDYVSSQLRVHPFMMGEKTLNLSKPIEKKLEKEKEEIVNLNDDEDEEEDQDSIAPQKNNKLTPRKNISNKIEDVDSSQTLSKLLNQQSIGSQSSLHQNQKSMGSYISFPSNYASNHHHDQRPSIENPLEMKLQKELEKRQTENNSFKDNRLTSSGCFSTSERPSAKVVNACNSEEGESGSMLAGENKSLMKLIKQHQQTREKKFSPLLNYYDSAASHDEDAQSAVSKSNCMYYYNDEYEKNADNGDGVSGGGDSDDFLQKIMQNKINHDFDSVSASNFTSNNCSRLIKNNNSVKQLERKIDPATAINQLYDISQTQKIASSQMCDGNITVRQSQDKNNNIKIAQAVAEKQKSQFFNNNNYKGINQQEISQNELAVIDNNQIDKNLTAPNQYEHQLQETISSLDRSPIRRIPLDKSASIPSPHLSAIDKSPSRYTLQQFDISRIKTQQTHSDREDESSNSSICNKQPNLEQAPQLERKFTFNHPPAQQDNNTHNIHSLAQQVQNSSSNNSSQRFNTENSRNKKREQQNQQENERRKPEIFQSVYASQSSRIHPNQINIAGRIQQMNNVDSDIISHKHHEGNISNNSRQMLSNPSAIERNSSNTTNNYLKEVHSKYINASDLKVRLEQFHQVGSAREVHSEDQSNSEQFCFEEQPIVGLDESDHINHRNIHSNNLNNSNNQNMHHHNIMNNNNFNEQYKLFDELVQNQDIASSYMLNTKMRKKMGIDAEELKKLFEERGIECEVMTGERGYDTMGEDNILLEQATVRSHNYEHRERTPPKQQSRQNTQKSGQKIKSTHSANPTGHNQEYTQRVSSHKKTASSCNSRSQSNNKKDNTYVHSDKKNDIHSKLEQNYFQENDEGIERSQILLEAVHQQNGDSSFTSALGYEKEVVFDKKNNIVIQRERKSSLVKSQICNNNNNNNRQLPQLTSQKDQVLREDYTSFDKEQELFVFKSFLDPIEFQVQGYFQQLLVKIEELIKRFNDQDCLNCVLVTLSIMKIRLGHLMALQLTQSQQLQQQQSQKIKIEQNLNSMTSKELTTKISGDQNIKSIDQVIDRFLERSTLAKWKDLQEPQLYWNFRRYIFIFYNNLTGKIYNSEQETNTQLKLAYDKLIQMGRIAYHLLVLSHYSKSFKLYFKDIYVISNQNNNSQVLPNLFEYIEEKISFMDLNQLHFARTQLKQFLLIQTTQNVQPALQDYNNMQASIQHQHYHSTQPIQQNNYQIQNHIKNRTISNPKTQILDKFRTHSQKPESRNNNSNDNNNYNKKNNGYKQAGSEKKININQNVNSNNNCKLKQQEKKDNLIRLNERYLTLQQQQQNYLQPYDQHTDQSYFEQEINLDASSHSNASNLPPQPPKKAVKKQIF